jgi:hypothetical protein
LRLGNVGKCKLAAHAIEEDHRIDRHKTDIVQIEPNDSYRKYKAAAYMLCTNNPISPQSVDISSIWFSIKKKEI